MSRDGACEILSASCFDRRILQPGDRDSTRTAGQNLTDAAGPSLKNTLESREMEKLDFEGPAKKRRRVATLYLRNLRLIVD